MKTSTISCFVNALCSQQYCPVPNSWVLQHFLRERKRTKNSRQQFFFWQLRDFTFVRVFFQKLNSFPSLSSSRWSCLSFAKRAVNGKEKKTWLWLNRLLFSFHIFCVIWNEQYVISMGDDDGKIFDETCFTASVPMEVCGLTFIKHNY